MPGTFAAGATGPQSLPAPDGARRQEGLLMGPFPDAVPAAKTGFFPEFSRVEDIKGP